MGGGAGMQKFSRATPPTASLSAVALAKADVMKF